MKRMIQFLLAGLVVVMLGTVNVALADPPATPSPGATVSGSGKLGFTLPCFLKLGGGTCDNLMGVLNSIVAVLMSIAITLFFFMFLYGGIQYIVSGGVPAQTTAAKSTMLNAGIGLVIVIGAWSIIVFILKALT